MKLLSYQEVEQIIAQEIQKEESDALIVRLAKDLLWLKKLPQVKWTFDRAFGGMKIRAYLSPLNSERFETDHTTDHFLLEQLKRNPADGYWHHAVRSLNEQMKNYVWEKLAPKSEMEAFISKVIEEQS